METSEIDSRLAAIAAESATPGMVSNLLLPSPTKKVNFFLIESEVIFGQNHGVNCMNLRILMPALLVSTFFFSSTAHAATTIASSDFETDADGWRTGEFTDASAGAGNPTYDAINKLISTTDTAANVAFIAPSKFRGNLSAAFGGNIVFRLSNIGNDNPALYSAIAITSGGTTIFSTRVLGPATTLTPYSVVFTGANFIRSTPFSSGGAPVTDSELQGILANVSKFAILADWDSGPDNTRLDNVTLTAGGPAVPEPGTWAMFILGLGFVGAAIRSRNSASAVFSVR